MSDRVADVEVTTLGEIVRRTGGALQTGPFGSQLHASDYTTFGMPLIMPINLGDNEIREAGIARVGPKDARRLRRHALREGDIVFSRRGDVGRRSIVRAEQAGWLCGTGCLAARFGSNLSTVNPEYLANYLGSKPAQTWLRDNAVGGTMPNLNTSILAALPLHLPARTTQDEIVDALDDAGSAIANIELLIAKKEAIKQGMVQQLLTGRTRLPGFSDPWHTRYLGSLGKCIRGVGYDPDHDLSTGDRQFTVRLLRANNVQDGRIDHDGLRYVHERRVRPDQVLRQGDIVICMANGSRALVGKSALFDAVDHSQRYTFGAFMGAFRVLDISASPQYVAGILNTHPFRSWLDIILSGSSINNLRPGDIEEFACPMPGLQEQEAISQVLSDVDVQLAALRARLAKARNVKTGMMQRLLTGRTRLPVQETAA